MHTHHQGTIAIPGRAVFRLRLPSIFKLLLGVLTLGLAAGAQAAATGVPGTPNLTQSNWDGSGSYSIIMNMWWGNNGTTWQLYENGTLVSTQTLTDGSPNAQTASFAFSGKANGSYTYTTKLSNSFGTTAGSTLVYTVTQGGTVSAPAVPAGLTATVNGTNQITVTWTAVSGATGYDLLRDGTTVSSVTSPYIHTGLTAGSMHTYEIRAKNSAGTSAWSAAVSATTQTTATIPPVPTGLAAAVNSSSQITVTWNASSNATGYDLQVDGATVANVTSPYVHSGLLANSTHVYAVRAKNTAGNSAFSASVSATTQTVTLPAVPTSLAAAANGTSQIIVTWNAVSNATSYDLQVDGATVSSITSPYTHSGLAAGSKHTYAVRAKNSAGSSAFSATVSATTSSSSGSTLTLGQVANPNCRYFAGYYPTWSDNWFTVTNWDGTKKSDNDIYTASNLAQIRGVYTHVQLAFAQPDFSWGGMTANSWSGTGLNFNATPVDIKEVIRLLHVLKKKVILAVGGATYNNWAGLAAEAGKSGTPIKGALTKFLTDLGVDGLDVDYEVDGADAGNVAQYAKAIQALREASDAAGAGHLLTIAAWSTGADYTAATTSDPGYPGTPSYWGGSAGRERLAFKAVVGSGSLSGRTVASLFDVVNIMAYDAQTYHYDPVTAFDEYRGIVPASVTVSLGLEIPPEGWAGGLLVINNSDAGADGTIVVADQYGRTPRGPYSVQRSGGYVLANTHSANPHDGLMLWQILKTQSVPAGSAQSANANTVADKVTSLFGYVPASP